MHYDLSKTQVQQIVAWVEVFDKYYSNSDVLILRNIVKKAIANMFLDESDVYKLIEVLPRIIPSPNEKPQIKPESQTTDWNEYIDEHRARYRREMELLLQTLTNWVFMQNAIYRKNMGPVERSSGKVKSNNIGQGL